MALRKFTARTDAKDGSRSWLFLPARAGVAAGPQQAAAPRQTDWAIPAKALDNLCH